MPRFCSGVGLLGLAVSFGELKDPKQQAGPQEAHANVGMRLAKAHSAKCVCIPFPSPIQLCPCPSGRGRASPGYARNAAAAGLGRRKGQPAAQRVGGRVCAAS